MNFVHNFFIEKNKYNEKGYVKDLLNVKLKLLKWVEKMSYFAIWSMDTGINTIDTMGKKYRYALMPDFFYILTPPVPK